VEGGEACGADPLDGRPGGQKPEGMTVATWGNFVKSFFNEGIVSLFTLDKVNRLTHDGIGWSKGGLRAMAKTETGPKNINVKLDAAEHKAARQRSLDYDLTISGLIRFALGDDETWRRAARAKAKRGE
jgi:hypothetical protein